MQTRDPRIDPQPGDVVKKGKTRRVNHRKGDEVFYMSGGSMVERSCWITTWQDWCRDAEVLHAA
jgi:hypothetical protein